MPVIRASRLLGKPLKERVAGVDLFEALVRRASDTGWRVFMRIPFAMGVVGAFGVAIRCAKRAPLWMQRAGQEWFYRFLQEPRRMFRPYFIDDMALVWLFIREMAHGRK